MLIGQFEGGGSRRNDQAHQFGQDGSWDLEDTDSQEECIYEKSRVVICLGLHVP